MKGNQMTSFAEAIKTTAKKTKTTKKSTCPVIDDAPAAVKEAVDMVVEGKREAKEAAAKISKGEAVVFDHVKPIQDNDGFNHSHSKSYEVVGNEETVKYVTQDRFTLTIDDEENIRELTGDKFDEDFEIDTTVTLKKDVFADEAKQEKLMNLLTDPELGNLFAEFFETKQTLKTKKGFDTRQFGYKEDTLTDLRIFVKQYKAALR
jgi:hypothetical protein